MKRKRISNTLRKAVFARDSMTCVYCGGAATCIDHVIPVAYRDLVEFENLVSSCRACNLRLSDKVFDSLEAKQIYAKTQRVVQQVVKVEEPREPPPHWTDGFLLEDFNDDDEYGMQVWGLIHELIDADDIALLDSLL